VSGIFSFLFDIILPQQCVRCGRQLDNSRGGGIFVIPQGWPDGAGGFFPLDVTFQLLRGIEIPARLLCNSCWLSMKPATPSFTSFASSDVCRNVISPFITNDTLLHVIRFMKYAGGKSASASLSWWMTVALIEAVNMDGIEWHNISLVPVPLHFSREKMRGYNQAELLARGISRLTGVPVEEGAIIRVRKTNSQATTPFKLRAENVKGAFSLIKPESIYSRDVILVDDIVTSGATALSCVDSLNQGEPSSVSIISAGRASTFVSLDSVEYHV
jgi:ComF family protein